MIIRAVYIPPEGSAPRQKESKQDIDVIHIMSDGAMLRLEYDFNITMNDIIRVSAEPPLAKTEKSGSEIVPTRRCIPRLSFVCLSEIAREILESPVIKDARMGAIEAYKTL